MTDGAYRGRRFLEPGAGVDFDRARVAVLPMPYEATVSWRGGTRHGPRAILEASEQLELHDERSGTDPSACGIWTASAPDLEGLDGTAMTRLVESRVGQLLDAGKWVVMLGGEHSITPGAVQAAAARHPGLRVLQLDAHADLREDYGGDRYSHACAMARCLEFAEVRALGVRSYSAAEASRIQAGIPGYAVVHAWEMEQGSKVAGLLDGLVGRPVYLTIDVDFFDPSIIPATGTPEPGGGGWEATLALLGQLFRTTRVVAADVVELAPAPGLHHAEYTLARLVYRLIGLAATHAAS